jgi:small-conductance mechanosensitive channel
MITPEQWNNLLKDAMGLLPRLGASVAVFLAFWLAAVLAAGAITRLGRSRRVDPDVVGLLAQSSKVGLLLFGIITALGTVGVNVSAMVAGLGLTGLALGLALKEVVSNAVAGVLILIYKPFKRGDVVAVLTFKGLASEINLRYTTLETPEGRVFVPNTLLLTTVMMVGNGAAISPAVAPSPPAVVPPTPEQDE